MTYNFAFASDSSSAAADPFAARHGKSLPAGLRAECSAMSWTEFESTYAAMSGPIRLGAWSSEKIAPGRWTFEATLGLGERIQKASATSTGAISAMTSMLHDAGISLEILSFHQHQIGHRTATFIFTECDGRRSWAMGIAESSTESSLRAMTSAANRFSH
ncbi:MULTISPECIES: alpha-isopropylmalate synthase regulatory domain-containing protein [unclassified Rhodococcus (in: high G+C Gram-positive bacteria)]|uniref:alpha-isopropylmalate synthase regulatory domain-containing protein n=1 Tax=unclassified Rhodococcus (in: high G+C Gram-positive bacteria) TaxID=192944 RepID=UPI0024B86B37|nr:MULTISPECIES: alpha-isopropylmalate synthase regulatory domain-containing protein [unclassified Rhodococcus (in: high G+C Gram-positive bacteria)]MDI9956476.1 alpha-isopropylmalate synthase regulatory domain-containing protein [Rhodococcus sp. IEGM 1237]MDI9964114.1 alpha-isopropylmalate synthase regulatory domain-containing protein [Rhodococcus sp. IEGM 1251]MDV8124469.1 alpha-isopropylmalate synthase regulatory domain-containing protein [Rhodococcus sp. IEGM 1304]